MDVPPPPSVGAWIPLHLWESGHQGTPLCQRESGRSAPLSVGKWTSHPLICGRVEVSLRPSVGEWTSRHASPSVGKWTLPPPFHLWKKERPAPPSVAKGDIPPVIKREKGPPASPPRRDSGRIRLGHLPITESRVWSECPRPL